MANKKTKNNKKTRKNRKTRKNKRTRNNKRIIWGGADNDVLAEEIIKLCPELWQCSALGQYTTDINKFFDFNTFNNVNSVDYSDDVYNNRNITTITYKKSKYLFYAKLKSILKEGQFDMRIGLYYEYCVGKYINTLINKFPCFIETYGLFKHDSLNIITTIDDLKKLTPIDNYKETDYRYNFHLLTQYDLIYKGLVSDKVRKEGGGYLELSELTNELTNDLLYILYQIYMPLMCLKEKFIYNGLNLDGNNIFLYELSNNKYINYIYHVKGNEIRFKSRYIVKLINYGGSYFYENEQNNSEIIYKLLYNSNPKKVNYDKNGTKLIFYLNTNQNSYKVPQYITYINSMNIKTITIDEIYDTLKKTIDKQDQKTINDDTYNDLTEFGCFEIYDDDSQMKFTQTPHTTTIINSIDKLTEITKTNKKNNSNPTDIKTQNNTDKKMA